MTKTPAEEFYNFLPDLRDPNLSVKALLRLKQLLQDGGDLFHEGDFGMTTLHMAVMFDLREGFEKLVDILKKSKPDVLDLGNSIRFTALHEAAQEEMSEQAEVLLRKGADVNASTGPNNAEESPIHIAARFGSLQVLRVLLENGADVDKPNKLKETALHIAAAINHVECVSLLLLHKADFELKDVNSFTPLHVAASVGANDVVKLLCERGANFRLKTYRGWGCLHLAAHKNQHRVIEELLARVDAKKNELKNDPNKQGQTPLHLAVKIKHDKTHSVKLLLEQKADVHSKDNQGRTALHIAIQRGNILCVQELLMSGADKDRKNRDGCTPLHLALQFQDYSLTPPEQASFRDACVQKLLLKGAKISSDRKRQTPLHVAAKYDNPQVIMELLNRGADINARDNDGMTPLHVASIYGKHVFVQSLLDKGLELARVDAGKGIDVDEKDSQGRTALYMAVALKCIECAEALLAKGADGICRNNNGLTPLHKAAYVADENLMELLKDHRDLEKEPRDLEVADNEGWMPVHIAAIRGARKCLELLLRAGAKVSPAMPATGFTALHLSAKAGHVSCLEVLLKHGADVGALTLDGDTALKLAQDNGRAECVKLLTGKREDDKEKTHSLKRQTGTVQHGHRVEQEGRGNVTKDSVPFRRPAYEDHEDLELEEESVECQMDVSVGGDETTSQQTIPTAPLTPEDDTCEKRLQLDGCRLKKLDAGGESCLHREAALGHANHLATLIARGADTRKRNSENRTPLHVAAEVGATECVTLLAGDGNLSLEPKDKDNCTPLHLASARGHVSCVEILLEKGKLKLLKLLATRNIRGENALHLASTGGHATCIQAMMSKLGESEQKSLIETKTEGGSSALHLAAGEKHNECVRLLVSYGADLTSANHKKRTVLEITAAKNNAQILEELLVKIIEDFKENKEKTDKILSDLLFFAVKYDAPECLVILIDKGADILIKNEQNMTAMQIAMDRHHINCVKVLLNKMTANDKMSAMQYAAKNGYGVSLGVLTEDRSLNVDAADVDGLTALQMSAAHGHVDCIAALIARGADVNLADQYGYTALHLASRDGHAPCVRLLLQHSARVNAADLRNATPLHFAAKENRTECLRILLEADAEPDHQTKEEWAAIHWAAKFGHVDCVKLLVEKNADYNITTLLGYTPLIFATTNYHANVVAYLVSLKNIILDARESNRNNTALHVAVNCGYLECARMILEAGANLDAVDGHNNTALNVAAKQNKVDFVEILLKNGADINKVNNAGYTPLLLAAKHGSEDCVKLLVSSGADVDHADDRTKKTLLHYAVLKNRLEWIKLCLDHGADLTKKDNKGLTPVELARKRGCNASIVKALEEAALSKETGRK